MTSKQTFIVVWICLVFATLFFLSGRTPSSKVQVPPSADMGSSSVLADVSAPTRINLSISPNNAQAEADSVLRKIFERQKEVFKKSGLYEYDIKAFSDLIPPNAINVYSVESENGGFFPGQKFVASACSQLQELTINEMGVVTDWGLKRHLFTPNIFFGY